MATRRILGIDPGTGAVGWALLVPRGSVWELEGTGSLRPKLMAKKAFKGLETQDDIYRAAATGVLGIAGGFTSTDTLVGIERVAFFMLSMQSLVTGASVGASISTALWAATGISPISVVPTAWQSILGCKKRKLNSKSASEDLARSVYGTFPDTQDECDALAVAHYIAHLRGRPLPYIDADTAMSEYGIPAASLISLGRAAASDALAALLAASQKTRALSSTYEKALETYHKNVADFRKKNSLPPKTKVTINGLEKALSE